MSLTKVICVVFVVCAISQVHSYRLGDGDEQYAAQRGPSGNYNEQRYPTRNQNSGSLGHLFTAAGEAKIAFADSLDKVGNAVGYGDTYVGAVARAAGHVKKTIGNLLSQFGL